MWLDCDQHQFPESLTILQIAQQAAFSPNKVESEHKPTEKEEENRRDKQSVLYRYIDVEVNLDFTIQLTNTSPIAAAAKYI